MTSRIEEDLLRDLAVRIEVFMLGVPCAFVNAKILKIPINNGVFMMRFRWMRISDS